MTKLYDLMSLEALKRAMEEGYVRVRTHPADPALRIFNYTEKAQYEKHWTDVTRQTRGLIVDGRTQDVIARPFDKFFNLGEWDQQAVQDVMHEPVSVTDKMDGSLGILYSGPDGLAIATRGSFESEQAIWATAVLRSTYANFRPMPGVTYLFEIIYPENRIVLDYKDTEDLFLIGLREIHDGQVSGPGGGGARTWPGPKAEVLHAHTTFEHAAQQADRANREGIVVRIKATNAMVKVKQEDYVRLHKLVTGLNERAVWEHLAAHNGTYGDLLASVPDEFHDWVTTTAEALLRKYDDLQGIAHETYSNILTIMRSDGPDSLSWDRDDRKAFAGFARECEIVTPFLFQMLDGRDIAPAIWKTLKPKGETNSLMNRNEDNA